MAEIFPFRGWRYDTGKVHLADVLTQPYDKITPAMQDRYYAASPFNLIPVEKGKSLPGDSEGNNVYTRAAAKLEEWVRSGILMQDAQPSIYVYAQEFTPPGANQFITRRGFIALGRVEDYSAGVVFRHEKTLSQPKADRLELLRRTRTQTGQLFMLYEDRAGEIDPLMDAAMNAPPTSELQDEFGVRHRLWKVSDAATVTRFCSLMAPKKIVIADGHHRYETAIAYRDECRRNAAAPDPYSPNEKAMMTFINYAAPGLVILPTHRVIRNLRDFHIAEFREKLAAWFEEVPIARGPQQDSAFAQENFRRALHEHAAEHAIGVYTTNGGCALNRLRYGVSLEGVLPDLSPAQRSLDVVLLHRLILEKCLGVTAEAVTRESHIVYEREMGAAIFAVDRGDAQMAFLLNPINVTQMAEMALAGDVLPQKSTDFYPKLLSGVAIYRLV